MKKNLMLIVAFMFVAGSSQMALAGEHGGKEHGGSTTKEHGGSAKKEHGGQEHGGTAVKTPPSKEDIRSTMRNYVLAQAASTGGLFHVYDPDTGETLKLIMERVHQRVGKTGDYYYSCADFRDADGNLWDLDLDVEDKHGRLSVVDVRVHKKSGEPSYTYDSQDNRHPLKVGTKRHLGMHAAGSMKMSPGSKKEHGGQEHGGKTHAQEHGGN